MSGVVFITGSGRRIGRALALGFAERGWRALFERRSWERLPWSRPTLAWHLGQFLLHDLWERLAWRGRRVQGALAVPAPAPGLPESHPVP